VCSVASADGLPTGRLNPFPPSSPYSSVFLYSSFPMLHTHPIPSLSTSALPRRPWSRFQPEKSMFASPHLFPFRPFRTFSPFSKACVAPPRLRGRPLKPSPPFLKAWTTHPSPFYALCSNPQRIDIGRNFVPPPCSFPFDRLLPGGRKSSFSVYLS